MKKQINLSELVSAIELPLSCLDFIKLDYQNALEGLDEFKKLVKKQRRILSTKYHPDKPGGDADKMKAVNNVVDFLLTLRIEPPVPVHQTIFVWNYSNRGTTGTTATTTSTS